MKNATELVEEATRMAVKAVEACPSLSGDLAFQSSLQLLIADEMQSRSEPQLIQTPVTPFNRKGH